MIVGLGMLFLTLSNVSVQFAEKKLIWKTYTIKEALPTICRVKLTNQKEFAKVSLDKNIKAFVVHVSSLELRITIYLARKAQMAFLLAEKVIVPAKYLDVADVFSKKSANILAKQTRVNEHVIKLEDGN